MYLISNQTVFYEISSNYFSTKLFISWVMFSPVKRSSLKKYRYLPKYLKNWFGFSFSFGFDY